jgi:hypothetical protein
MVDIILLEYMGKAWLIRGEQYIDDLLVNALPKSISIDIITCESESDVNDLWRREGWDSSRPPCLIHPAIVRRLRRTQSGNSVFFSQWSALLDEAALEVLRDVATAAEAASGVEVLLIGHSRPDHPPAMTDLTNLRFGLVEAELTRLGVLSSRIVREVRGPAIDLNPNPDAERVDIRIGRGVVP